MNDKKCSSQSKSKSFHEVVVDRLRRHAEAGDRRSFDMTAQFNAIPKRESENLWNDCMRARESHDLDPTLPSVSTEVSQK